jgi:hypothetical protein
MLAMVQSMVQVALRQEEEPHIEVANAAVSSVQQQMLEILQAMQAAQIAQSAPTGGQTANNSAESNPRRRRNRRTPDDAAFDRQDKSKYCHTHGMSNHTSADCNRRAPGHKTAATFTNRMGGSNAFCTPVNNE